ncbi:MAG TPA: branched-chain amino acid ABC transporter permease [Chloroflexota bacterium]
MSEATVEQVKPLPRSRAIAPGPPLVWLIIGLVAITLPFWLLTSQFAVGIAIRVLVFACLALGWNLIGGFGGQVSFGNVMFFGLGAYTSTLLLIRFDISPWLGMLVGMLLSCVAALIVGLPCFRLRGHYFSLATFACSLILQVCFTYFDKLTGGDVGIYPPLLGNRPEYFEFTYLSVYYYVGLGMVALSLVLSWAFLRSRFGIYLMALRDSHEAAESLGVNTTWVKMAAFLLGAIISTYAGTLYVQYTYFIDPSTGFGLAYSLQIALLAIVGGMSVVWGPLLGAVVLIPVAEYLNATVGASYAGVQLLIYAVVLILCIVLLPRGLADGLQRLARRARKWRPT